MKTKNIAVLGSTGSIGTQTLEVIRNNDDMRVVSLAAGSNITLLQKQIEEFSPKLVCVFDKKKAEELQKNLKNPETEIVTGMDGLIACATIDEADIAVAAVVGMIGIKPVIEAVKSGKRYCLCKQRDTCYGRSYNHANDKKIWCETSSGRQRTFGNIPES